MELNDIFTYTFLAKEMRIGKGLRIKERNLLSGKIIFPQKSPWSRIALQASYKNKKIRPPLSRDLQQVPPGEEQTNHLTVVSAV